MKNADFDYENGVLTVSLSGEIDHHNAALLRSQIDESMRTFNARNLIIDYSGVSFMDSSGIGLAMGRFNKVKEKNGELVIVPGTPYVDRILSLAGVYGIMQGRDSRQKAMEYILSERSCADENDQ